MNETWWVDPTQLDDDQKKVLVAEPEASLLIVGPPGSGKTNILMLRANFVRPIGTRQQFFTFTRPLAEHLRSGPNIGRADQLQKEEISTFMGWAKRLIRTYGGEIPADTGEFDVDRKAVNDALEAIVSDQSIGEIYDVSFVDEVQDFWKAELDLIWRLSSRVNFAGDARQRIWKHREGLRVASEYADVKVPLEHHYRIGENICLYADKILPPRSDEAALIDGCNYPERLRPSSVEPVPCLDVDTMVTLCIDKVKDQLRYVTEEPIGVIGPYHAALDAFMEAARADPQLAHITVRQRADDYHAYNDNSRVRVMTVHSAKGSEFRTVHLLDAQGFTHLNRELAFTAVTRAKTEVSVYHIGPLKGHMVPTNGTLTDDLATIF